MLRKKQLEPKTRNRFKKYYSLFIASYSFLQLYLHRSQKGVPITAEIIPNEPRAGNAAKGMKRHCES